MPLNPVKLLNKTRPHISQSQPKMLTIEKGQALQGAYLDLVISPDFAP